MPADRHASLYPSLYPSAMPPSISKPSFNEQSVADKPRHMRSGPVSRRKVIENFRSRIRSLRAVDDQVGALVATLKEAGELDNTVIIFTSDNGYLLGEHRLTGKNLLYEEALQVPMLLTGPGIPAGATQRTATMVDVAPTIAALAGVVPQRLQDGTSMLSPMNGGPGHHRVLIQAGAETEEPGWLFRGIRDAQWTYAEHHTGAVELYNRTADPYQLNNLSGKKPKVSAKFAAILDSMRNCSGLNC